MTSQLFTGTLEYLRRPLVTNIKPGQKVLVITDTAHDPRVWQAVMSVLTELGADGTVAIFDPRPADYYDPPETVCKAMLESDVNILLASTGMLHSPANAKAMHSGIPTICMDGGMTLEMFQSGAATVDQKAMMTEHYYVGKNVFGLEANECRVTSKYGTDLTYNVKGMTYIPNKPGDDYVPYKIRDIGKAQNKKSTLFMMLYPNGEFNVAPHDKSANGKLVFDLCMHQVGRLYDPIELTIVDSRITDIDGGAEAHFLKNYLDKYGDENSRFCPAEASVGINRNAIIRGIQREDKNVFGTMHFGVGTNADVGGTIISNIHLDGVILKPTLYVDGVKKIEDGEFLVPLDRDMD